MNDKENGLDNVEAMDYSASRGTLTTFSDYPAAGGCPGLAWAGDSDWALIPTFYFDMLCQPALHDQKRGDKRCSVKYHMSRYQRR